MHDKNRHEAFIILFYGICQLKNGEDYMGKINERYNKKTEGNTALMESKYKGQSVSISNEMIRSREKTTLLESKIEILAIHQMGAHMKEMEKKDSSGKSYTVHFVEIPAGDIKEIIGRRDGSAYEDIKNAVYALKGKIIIIEDRENKCFAMKSFYGDVSYSDGGMVHIEFIPDMEEYFLSLRNNYTRLSLPVLFSFKKNGGFQLYKLLKSYAYPPTLEPLESEMLNLSQEELPSTTMPWSVTNLRMQMGYVDILQNELKKEGLNDIPNWEKMVQAEKKPKYKRWIDFYNRVIKPGIEEINEISDIYISNVDKIGEGRGGKVFKVIFYVQHNLKYYRENGLGSSTNIKKKETEEPKLSDEQIDDFIDEMGKIITDKLKIKDFKAIAKASNYDIEKVRYAYELSEKSGSDIDNLAGWMITAIKKRYSEPVRKKAKNNKIHFAYERQYDFDDLEETLLRNQREKNQNQ